MIICVQEKIGRKQSSRMNQSSILVVAFWQKLVELVESLQSGDGSHRAVGIIFAGLNFAVGQFKFKIQVQKFFRRDHFGRFQVGKVERRLDAVEDKFFLKFVLRMNDDWTQILSICMALFEKKN